MTAVQNGRSASPADRRLVFMAVGAMGLGVQLLVLRLLATGTTLALQMSMVLAVEAALLHNFVWHERWTWADRNPAAAGAWQQRLTRFHLTNGVLSIAGNLVLTSLLVAVAGLHYLVANVLAVAACTVLNFLAADRLVFAGKEHR
jgi:putative flippase GtrA